MDNNLFIGELMKTIWGLVLISFGMLVLFLGAKSVAVEGGAVLKTVSQKPLAIKIIRWAVALLSIWFGIAVALGAA